MDTLVSSIKANNFKLVFELQAQKVNFGDQFSKEKEVLRFPKGEREVSLNAHFSYFRSSNVKIVIFQTASWEILGAIINVNFG